MEMTQFSKEKLEEILELGKKLFKISETGEIRSFTHPYGYGTDSSLMYYDSEHGIHITNEFADLERSNSKQGPYEIHVSVDSARDKHKSVSVFFCYFYGAPELSKDIKNQLPKNFKREEFRIDINSLSDRSKLPYQDEFLYTPGAWVKYVNELYKKINKKPQ